MIDELKLELEKTFNRKITDRGHCEALVQDIYEKTGALLSYNTLRRLFGLAEFRKPRENTLDQLSLYCGFRSYKDFCQRFTEVDTWPVWESLYVGLSSENTNEMIDLLRYRQSHHDHFSISFTIIVRELINRRDLAGLLSIFRESAFQFGVLPYDEVAQIGVLIGLHFRNFSDSILEEKLLLEPNFRDLVFKIFVDYARLNQKYGQWVQFLMKQSDLDSETTIFITCIELWRSLLIQTVPEQRLIKTLPKLTADQHPILFGRIFGMKMILNVNTSVKKRLIEQLKTRLQNEPHFATELLYEPCVQCLVLRDSDLKKVVHEHAYLINDIKFWYHFSQVSIHRVFQVSILIEEGQFTKAKSILENIPYGHLRHGYREIIELYVSFFNWEISKELGIADDSFERDFLRNRKKLNYPIFTDAYFENYFSKQS